MAEERIDMPKEFDPDAPVAQGAPDDVMLGLARIRFIQMLTTDLEAERKKIQREIIPQLRGPIALLDPVNGEPVVATVIQSKTKVIDAQELRTALYEHFVEEGMEREDAMVKADGIWSSTLKPPTVDTKEEGLFDQAYARGEIPLSVVSQCAYLKPSNAYIGFPKSRK